MIKYCKKDVYEKIKTDKQLDKMENIDYSNLSYSLNKSINMVDKKKNGIFFTPPKTIINNLIFLEPYMKNIKNVLEPSCGSCEYILLLNNIASKIAIINLFIKTKNN